MEEESKRSEVRRSGDEDGEDLSVVGWTVREKTFPMGEVSLADTRATREKEEGSKEKREGRVNHTCTPQRIIERETNSIAQKRVDCGSTDGNTKRATTMVTALFSLSLSHSLHSLSLSFCFFFSFSASFVAASQQRVQDATHDDDTMFCVNVFSRQTKTKEVNVQGRIDPILTEAIP